MRIRKEKKSSRVVEGGKGDMEGKDQGSKEHRLEDRKRERDGKHGGFDQRVEECGQDAHAGELTERGDAQTAKNKRGKDQGGKERK